MCTILTPGEQTSKNKQILPYVVGGCNVLSCNMTDDIHVDAGCGGHQFGKPCRSSYRLAYTQTVLD